MNGKQAKKLRRAAMGLATTFDQGGHKIDANGYELQEHKEASAASISSNPKVAFGPSEPTVTAVTIHNKKNTLRGIYRYIKKGVTSGKIRKP